jgi:hypothetical protein
MKRLVLSLAGTGFILAGCALALLTLKFLQDGAGGLLWAGRAFAIVNVVTGWIQLVGLILAACFSFIIGLYACANAIVRPNIRNE